MLNSAATIFDTPGANNVVLSQDFLEGKRRLKPFSLEKTGTNKIFCSVHQQ